MTARPTRDPAWYAEEAERLREKAAAAKEDGVLRNSYIGLAREYEKLAATLQRPTSA